MTRSERGWLKQFAGMVARELENVAIDTGATLTPTAQMVTYATNTEGWYTDIASVPTGRGDSLQIWLDCYARASSRRLYLCYKASQPPRAAAMAKVGVQNLGPAVVVDDSFYEKCGPEWYRMTNPLRKSSYGKPFAELYEKRNSWSFFGMYLPDSVKLRRSPPIGLVTRAGSFFAAVLRAAAVASVETAEAYPEAERRLVKKHLTRERAGKLASLAKIRDEFTCQICRINFGRLYGRVGRGFAEAHHRIPLSSPRATKKTRIEDLVTVCANCHRMLHRLSPVVDGVTKLLDLFTAKWPKSAHSAGNVPPGAH